MHVSQQPCWCLKKAGTHVVNSNSRDAKTDTGFKCKLPTGFYNTSFKQPDWTSTSKQYRYPNHLRAIAGRLPKQHHPLRKLSVIQAAKSTMSTPMGHCDKQKKTRELRLTTHYLLSIDSQF